MSLEHVARQHHFAVPKEQPRGSSCGPVDSCIVSYAICLIAHSNEAATGAHCLHLCCHHRMCSLWLFRMHLGSARQSGSQWVGWGCLIHDTDTPLQASSRGTRLVSLAILAGQHHACVPSYFDLCSQLVRCHSRLHKDSPAAFCRCTA